MTCSSTAIKYHLITSSLLHLKAEGTELELTISLFEIYRESVFDLLGGPEGSAEKIPCLEDGHGATSTHLTLYEDILVYEDLIK